MPLAIVLVGASALLVVAQYGIVRRHLVRMQTAERPTNEASTTSARLRRLAARTDAWLLASQVGLVITCVVLGWTMPSWLFVVLPLVVGTTAVAGLLAPTLLERRYPEGAAPLPRAPDLGRLTVRDLMVPRTRLDALPAELSREEARERMLEAGRARIPVYRENVDQIVGMLEWAKLFGSEGGDWATDVEPMLVVPESMDATDALAKMRERPVPEVLVVDEYGGTAGLLTMAALVTQLASRKVPVTLPASVPGEHPIHLLERDLSIEFPQTEATTLAGFIAERLGHIPAAGDAVEVAGHQLVVAAVTGRRIRTIRVE